MVVRQTALPHHPDGVRRHRLRQHAVAHRDRRRPLRPHRRRRQAATVADRRRDVRPNKFCRARTDPLGRASTACVRNNEPRRWTVSVDS